MNESYLQVAFRAYTTRQRIAKIARSESESRQTEKWPRDVLIIDTETTTDRTQRLIFGSFRHCEWTINNILNPLSDCLFYDYDLANRDPNALRELNEYAERRCLPLLSLQEFLEDYLWPAYGTQALTLIRK